MSCGREGSFVAPINHPRGRNTAKITNPGTAIATTTHPNINVAGGNDYCVTGLKRCSSIYGMMKSELCNLSLRNENCCTCIQLPYKISYDVSLLKHSCFQTETK